MALNQDSPLRVRGSKSSISGDLVGSLFGDNQDQEQDGRDDSDPSENNTDYSHGPALEHSARVTDPTQGNVPEDDGEDGRDAEPTENPENQRSKGISLGTLHARRIEGGIDDIAGGREDLSLRDACLAPTGLSARLLTTLSHFFRCRIESRRAA